MGLFDNWTRERRISKAADEMWAAVKKGANFEVPLTLSSDDDTVQAVALMQKRHPQVKSRLYQSRGVVIGLMEDKDSTAKVSELGWKMLGLGGYLGGADARVTEILDAHVRFLKTQGYDPKQQEKVALDYTRDKFAIDVKSKEPWVKYRVVKRDTHGTILNPGDPRLPLKEESEEEGKTRLTGWFSETNERGLEIRLGPSQYMTVPVEQVEALEIWRDCTWTLWWQRETAETHESAEELLLAGVHGQTDLLPDKGDALRITRKPEEEA